MFYIKSDDIEELFREAAEKYHIDTTGAEAWDDVQAAVHADDVPPPPPKKPRRRWFVLGWLLLVPLGWFAHNLWNGMDEPTVKTLSGQAVKQVHAGETKTLNANNNSSLSNTDGNKKPAVAATLPELKGKINEKPPIAGISSTFATKKANSSLHIRQADIAGNDADTRPGSNPRPGILNSKQPYGVAKAGENVQQPAVALAGATPKTADENTSNSIGKNSATATAAPTANIAGSLINPNQAAAANGNAKPDKKPAKAQHNHYFYAGLSVAPDLSFIHFQKTQTMGVGGGLLLGYHINNKFSLETGALIEKKYYYTNGEYFDISKVPYFVNNNIHPESATGDCNMVEIPLNLRYTFTTKGKNGFYAIGGISSYLMGHQDYTFDYLEWGGQRQSTWGYNNPAGYWFSILNLGAGYNRALGTKTNLRIEPYMKLPLSGLGTGNLKIASAGLYLTLTRKIP